MALRRWKTAEGNKELSQRIAAEYGISRFAAHLLVTRGCTDGDSIEKMIDPGSDCFIDPFAYADMDKAVSRIRSAIESFEHIMVYGDYDVDGITATALLYSYLEQQDANVAYMLPSRDENGYGLHNRVIDRMALMGVSLIITVDNGISACDEIAYASSLGIDVVVTDHHQPPEELPKAAAVVNPHRTDCQGPFKDYAGVGVAFKLVCALDGDAEKISSLYSDLVAMGTVADVVPLVGENRNLVVRGLKLLTERTRPGVAALMDAAGVRDNVTSTDIAFSISPRVNSAGRMGKPDRAVRLMVSPDEQECKALASELQAENARRHTQEQEISEEAWKMLTRHPQLLYDKIIVLCGKGWNHGVIGIFAAKLCENLGKPCIILSSDGTTAKGSGRSLGEFSLHDAVASCRDLLTAYGGHTLAVGLTMESGKVDEFRRRINEYAAEIEMPVPELELDCILPLRCITRELVDGAEVMQPFGACNPSPVVGAVNLKIGRITPLSSGRGARLVLENSGATLSAMLFNFPMSLFPYRVGDAVDCAIAVGRSDYYADGGVSAIIRDMRLSGADVESAIASDRVFEHLMRGGGLTREQAEKMLPDRRDFEAVYRSLCERRFCGTPEVLAGRLAPGGVTYARMRTAVCALEQCGLIRLRYVGGFWCIDINMVSRKADLEASGVISALRKYI